MNTSAITDRTRPVALAAAVLALLLLAPPGARADEGDGSDLGYDGSYSYLRVLEGSATLFQGDRGDRVAAEVNQPLLVGDRLWLAPRSRAEIILSDGNLFRVDGDSEVTFENLASSPDANDRSTVLRLRSGNVVLVVVDDAAGDELPRLETANATVYVQAAGTYRITSSDDDWSEVVVRSGYAEVVTDRGSVAVRPDEEVVVESSSPPRAVLRAASADDDLERWGDRLTDRLAARQVPYVDPSLRYETASLADYGSWVDVDSSWAWRPAVATDWRPYWQGRWVSTPAGLNWVSAEPWGWVPYHYGTWDYAPGYGWVWFPGTRFATSWVYWYWGPSYVAWVPVGYYTRHYYPQYRSGFRFGVYGSAGGDWNAFADWVFCPSGYFGSPYQNRYLRDGRDWHQHYGYEQVPRGVITTDTRGITPDRWHKPQEVMTVLRTRPGRGDLPGRADRPGDRELQDVTPFIARRDDLPQEVRRRVLVDVKPGGDLGGSPLAPATLGRVDGRSPAVRTLRRVDTMGPTNDTGPTGRVVGPRTQGEKPAAADPGPVRVDARPPVVRRNDDGGGVRPGITREVKPAEPAPIVERPVVIRRRDDGQTTAPGNEPEKPAKVVRPETPARPLERAPQRPTVRPVQPTPPTERPVVIRRREAEAPAAPRARDPEPEKPVRVERKATPAQPPERAKATEKAPEKPAEKPADKPVERQKVRPRQPPPGDDKPAPGVRRTRPAGDGNS